MKTVTISAEFPEFKGSTSYTGRGEATEWTSALSRAAKQLKRQIKHKRFTTIKAVISVGDSGEFQEPERPYPFIVKARKENKHRLLCWCDDCKRLARKFEDSSENERPAPLPKVVNAALDNLKQGLEAAKPKRCQCSHDAHPNGVCFHKDPEDGERDCFCQKYETF